MNIMELINNFKDPVLIEQLSLGEKISASLFVTLLGMTITFTALIVLWGLTAAYSKMVQNAEAKKKANAVVEVKPAAPAAPVVTAVEPEEDEGVIDFLIKKYPNAKVDEIKPSELPGLKRSKAVTEFNNQKYSSEVKKCLRIWPQDNDTEGFFITRIKKL